MIRNNQRRRRGGGNNGPRPQQMAGGNNYGNRLDNRQRGNATQLLEKYRALARDAQQAGDRVTAEYYLQYAEHYYRVLGDYRDRQPEGRGTGRQGREGFDDELQDNEELESDAADSDGDEDAGESGREDRGREERSVPAKNVPATIVPGKNGAVMIAAVGIGSGIAATAAATRPAATHRPQTRLGMTANRCSRHCRRRWRARPRPPKAVVSA